MEWFGKNCKFKVKDDAIYAEVKANETALIYWCLQYGESIELIEPVDVRQQIGHKLSQIAAKYNNK